MLLLPPPLPPPPAAAAAIAAAITAVYRHRPWAEGGGDGPKGLDRDPCP